ncbi:hypothetical protein ACIQU6_37705 [Streptomyces sp. NPDC090442]|uniref:hypothetical protein n=1 Tax=Streptomyces sp. NPDC090442 TaxID=3365962 RepID=UPI003818C7ED
MRRLQSVAIVIAAIGCLSTVGTGVSVADGYGSGPEAGAWAVSASAAGATSRGGESDGGPQAAPQAQAPAPQAAPQAPAPQYAPPAPVQQAPIQQAPVQQAPAPQYVPQAPAQQTASEKRTNVDIDQHTMCRSHDLNLNVLGQAGLLNGVLGNALNGEGAGGAQRTHQGSRMGCDNVALRK